MKCIKKDETIVIIADDEAHVRVTKYGWEYIPRSEWKSQVRDVKKTAKVQDPEVVSKHKATKERRAAKRIALNSRYGK